MSKYTTVKMVGVREYCEEYPVELSDGTNTGVYDDYTDRYVIRAINEGGHNSVEIDLIDLLTWLKENKPELLRITKEEQMLYQRNLAWQAFTRGAAFGESNEKLGTAEEVFDAFWNSKTKI